MRFLALPVALATLTLLAATSASAQTKIKVADSFPTGHFLARYLTTPMMDRLKADPAYKDFQFEYFPAEQMGKAKDLLQLVQNGVVDIAYVAPGFVSDKMPLAVVPELPLPTSGSCAASKAYWALAKPGGMLDKLEFAPNGVRLLYTVVLPPYQVFTRKPIDNLASLDGLKIRASGSAKELLLRKVKAVPVLMPTPEVYESLSRGTMDGVLFPIASTQAYGIDKLAKHATLGENFGAFVANWVISEKRFQSLPPKMQADLTAMGDEYVNRVCAQIENDEAGDIEKIKASGVKFAPLSAADRATLNKGSAEVAAEWAQTLDKRGKPGTEVLNALKAGIK